MQALHESAAPFPARRSRASRVRRRAGDPFPHVLSQLPLFRACTARELKIVARHSIVLRVPAGRVMVREGDASREFLAILAGHAGVTQVGLPSRLLGPNEWHGEVDLFARSESAVTVTTLTDLDVLVVERREFQGLIDAIPGFRHQIIASLARQIRSK
ncbi:MAG TPA: cyclic nucleotide-binding domain-containing protein [Acidimicrobiales bacterium]